MVPRQFFILQTAYRQKMEHAEFLAGTIAATTANFGMSKPEEWLTADSFFPSLRVAEKGKKKVKPVDTDASNRAFFSKWVPELRGNGNQN